MALREAARRAQVPFGWAARQGAGEGESALYLGRTYRIELVHTVDAGVRFAGKFPIPRAHVGARREVLRQWYVERAQEKILPRVCVHAKSLGVIYRQAKIGDSRFRWGLCTPSDGLNFNWRLIKAPMFAVDYVIVHELAHLIEANHTSRFWNIVRVQLPAMDCACDWLHEHVQSLEEDISKSLSVIWARASA